MQVVRVAFIKVDHQWILLGRVESIGFIQQAIQFLIVFTFPANKLGRSPGKVFLLRIHIT